MTAKEELRERLNRMSEEAAARLLAMAGLDEDDDWLIPGELEQHPNEERGRRLRAFFDDWEARGDEFARDFDAHRPHRPLFSAGTRQGRRSRPLLSESSAKG